MISDQLIATEDQEVGYAKAVVSDQASAIGITAVPTPVTDSASDLFHVYEMLFGSFSFLSSVGYDQVGGTRNVWTIDSKAMRKVNDDQDIVTMIETSGTSEGVIVVSFTRTLIKLH